MAKSRSNIKPCNLKRPLVSALIRENKDPFILINTYIKLLILWRRQAPGRQQQRRWPHFIGIFPPQRQMDLIFPFRHCWTWWRHQMKPSSALLAICAGNSPVTGEFPAQRPVTLSFDVFFDLRLNKRLSKQSWGWWFETPSHPVLRHCNDKSISCLLMDWLIALPGHQWCYWLCMKHGSFHGFGL